MLIFLILAAVLVTSTISGVFGMAGGLILMGVYAALLPVPAAMVLHGITQLAANGSRTWRLRAHIGWRIVGHYSCGVVVAVAAFSCVTVVLPTPALFFLLGGIPLVVGALPREWAPRIDRLAGALTSGVVVTAAQLLAGAAGPLLDAFYVRSELDRHAVVATKAFTQSLGHSLKLVYFGWVVPTAGLDDLPAWIIPAVVGFAILGTNLGGKLLDRLSDERFRSWSAVIVRALGLIFVARGVASLT